MTEVQENAGKQRIARPRRDRLGDGFSRRGTIRSRPRKSLRLGLGDPRLRGFCAKWGYLAVGAIFVHALVLALYVDVQLSGSLMRFWGPSPYR